MFSIGPQIWYWWQMSLKSRYKQHVFVSSSDDSVYEWDIIVYDSMECSQRFGCSSMLQTEFKSLPQELAPKLFLKSVINLLQDGNPTYQASVPVLLSHAEMKKDVVYIAGNFHAFCNHATNFKLSSTRSTWYFVVKA